jgi:hypothetical protein
MISKTAILCHGKHLEAINWELHYWGDNQNKKLGQIPKLALLTNQINPDLIFVGSGSSKKGNIYESEYIIKHMLNNFENLKNFLQFQDIDLTALKQKIQRITKPDTISQTTNEELINIGEIFLQEGITKVFILSNPDHLPRCAQSAHKIYQDPKYNQFNQNLYFVQSEIGFNGTTNPTTKIIEMPHRGDDQSPNLAEHIGSYFSLSLEKKKEFIEIVKNFMKED